MQYLVDKGGPHSAVLAGLSFGVGGALVEYWWPAIVLTVAAQRFVRSRSWVALITAVAATAALWPINGSAWALGSLVVIAAASQLKVEVPRVPWVFYVYYPAHLGAIWLATVWRVQSTGV